MWDWESGEEAEALAQNAVPGQEADLLEFKAPGQDEHYLLHRSSLSRALKAIIIRLLKPWFHLLSVLALGPPSLLRPLRSHNNS